MILFLIPQILLISCSVHKMPNENLNKKEFITAIESLTELSTGFSLFGNDISKFTPLIFDEELNLITNPLLKHVSDSALTLLSSKYPTDSSKFYYFVSKMKVNNNLLVTLIQDDIADTEYWMKFNLFSVSGELLDTLTFAGQKVYHFKMFGIFDKNLLIETRSYHDIEIDTTNQDKYHYRYFATEVKNRYIIKDTSFELIETIKERTLFTDVSDRKIVARLDTLKSHY
jgi:hypothetical protein